MELCEAAENIWCHVMALFALSFSDVLENHLDVLFSDTLLQIPIDAPADSPKQNFEDIGAAHDNQAEIQAEADLSAEVEDCQTASDGKAIAPAPAHVAIKWFRLQCTHMAALWRLTRFASKYRSLINIQLLASMSASNRSLPRWKEVIRQLYFSEDEYEHIIGELQRHVLNVCEHTPRAERIPPIFKHFQDAFDDPQKLTFQGTIHCEAALAAAIVHAQDAGTSCDWLLLTKVRPRR